MIEFYFKTKKTKRKRRVGLSLMIFLFPLTILAQTGTTVSRNKKSSQEMLISGTVRNNYGENLPGVTVEVKDLSTKTLTDSSGKYVIALTPGVSLIFTKTGYGVMYAKSKSEKLDVVLTELRNTQLAERLNDQRQKMITVQSSSTIYTEELITTPTPDFTNALSGRLAGLFTNQSNGAPGADNASLSLRGQTPLILFNGVPREYSSIDPEEIESVTILKDALSTAMLGLRSANGAILVKTKSGRIGKQQISLTTQFGLQTPTKLPQTLNAYNYAQLYNEALTNDGKATLYTAADIEAYRTGSDPIGYPNVDWYDTLLKPNARFSRHNLNASGGGNNARYFVGIDYLNQEGLYKEDEINTYRTNTDYKRYLIRSNIDIDLTKTLSLNLNLFGRIENGNYPGNNFNLFNNIAATPNNAYPVFNANGSLGGNSTFQNNLWGQSTRSGYVLGYSRDVSADVSLKRTFNGALKGLFVKAFASFNSGLNDQTNRTKTFAVYQTIIAPTNGTVSYTKFGNDGVQGSTGSQSFPSKNLYSEISAGYQHDFDHHEFQTLLLANAQSITPANINLPLNYKSLAASFDYNYKKKYIFQAAVSYSGLNRYPSGKRYGLLPAVGIAWNLAKEEYFKDHVQWIDDLKLRASYGRTANTEQMTLQSPTSSLYYGYNQYFANTSTYYFGNAATAVTGTTQGVLANNGLTWEKANKLEIGMDATLLRGNLDLSFSYYNNKFYDLLQIRGNNSTIIGATYPLENIGTTRFKGIEFSGSYGDHVGSFNYFISPNISLANSKIEYQDEEYRKYDWMRRTGLANNQIFGYIAEGFFQSTAEINSSAKPVGYNPIPGDIKYSDLNADGKIDIYDITSLRPDKPLLFYGLTFGFTVKGFDFRSLIQGTGNRTQYLSDPLTEFEFQNNGLGQAYQQHLERWTPATAAIATYPRLSIGANVNNQAGSSFWLHKGNYVRLKNVEIGYTLPSVLVQKVRVSSVRFFLNAYNLATIAQFSRVDPETNGSGYPAQRTINAGINIKL